MRGGLYKKYNLGWVKNRGVTQPAAAPHDEKSTININSFFQRGIAEFLSRFKSWRVDGCWNNSNFVCRMYSPRDAGLSAAAANIGAELRTINQSADSHSRFKSRAFVKVARHVLLT